MSQDALNLLRKWDKIYCFAGYQDEPVPLNEGWRQSGSSGSERKMRTTRLLEYEAQGNGEIYYFVEKEKQHGSIFCLMLSDI
jgi:hypothetical protein